MTASIGSNILWGLIFSHLLADFTFQTNYIAQWKEKSFWGRSIHVIIFLVVTMLIVFPSLNHIWFDFGYIKLYGWSCILVLTLLHLLEDNFRVWCVHQKKLPDDILFFLYDQFVHIGLIFLFTPKTDQACIFSPIIILLGILVILNTHFAVIFVYYVEKTFNGKAEIVSKEKFSSMAERMIIAACFLIPGWWWNIGILSWISYMFARKIAGKSQRSWINLSISYLIAILTGLLARIL